MTPFSAPSLTRLAEHYPERPVVIEHGLADHPLLQLSELVALAGRMRPGTVEHNLGDLTVGVAPQDVPANGLDPVATMEGIETNGSWMVLKFIEQDAAYARLLDEALAPIEAAIAPATGPMLKREGFLFVSSPGSMTPFHMDPEHNILAQVRGTKTFSVWPAGDTRFAPLAEHERFHAGGHRNLPWDDGFLVAGTPHELAAGQAIYVPVKAPHYVRNGPEVSVSLSVTWRSGWSFREQYAHGWNGWLRARGLRPRPPRRYPADNHLKSLAWRVAQRVGRG